MALSSESAATDTQGHAGRSDPPTPANGLAYVLIADGDGDRTARCLQAIKPFNVGALVARDGDEAIRTLRRFGPPILLIADLGLTGRDGFSVIDETRAVDEGRTAIIAWSPSKEVREYASHRLTGRNVHVLGGTATLDVLRNTISRMLSENEPHKAAATSTARTADDVREDMRDLSTRARQICRAAGVAVYLKADGATQFQASATWVSDDPIPRSLDDLPRALQRILDTRKTLVFRDLRTIGLSNDSTLSMPDVVRGLVAVPIVGQSDEIVGMICVFDLKPLTISGKEVERLEALGRSGVRRAPAATPDRPRQLPFRQPARAAAAESDAEPSAPTPPPPPSTPVLDRQNGYYAINRELARVRREHHALSVVLFDVAPGIEASASTDAGPDAIASAKAALTRTIRGSDLAIEWTPEELLVVLPGLREAEARPVAERIRAAMQAGTGHRAAISGGVAECSIDTMFQTTVDRAAEKLRIARERGRNRVG